MTISVTSPAWGGSIALDLLEAGSWIFLEVCSWGQPLDTEAKTCLRRSFGKLHKPIPAIPIKD